MNNTNNLTWQWQKMTTLSATEMHEILLERTKVFVVEQKCAYQEVDQWDQYSWHLIGRNQHHRLIAYARITFPNTKYNLPSIGRVLVTKEFRHLGYSQLLIKNCLAKCQLEYPNQAIFLQAQSYLKKFYEKFGFKPISAIYDDEGIDHLDMKLG